MEAALRRDVLFGAGCGLAAIGLFPYLQQAHLSSSSSAPPISNAAASSASSDCPLPRHQFIHPSTNTAFDSMSCLLSVTFALLGAGVMLLSVIVLPSKATTRVCLRVVGWPLCVLSVQSLLLVASIYNANDVARVWQTSILRSFGSEPLAHQVNRMYCHAVASQGCSPQELMFPSNATKEWCSSYSARSVTPKEKKEKSVDERLDPSSLLPSPYETYGSAILNQSENSPTCLAKSARLLLVLVAFALAAIGVLAQWYLATTTSITTSPDLEPGG